MDGQTICWYCKHAVPRYDEKTRQYTRGCEWSIYKQPVPGWVAAMTIIECTKAEKYKYSYSVKHCPKFEGG